MSQIQKMIDEQRKKSEEALEKILFQQNTIEELQKSKATIEKLTRQSNNNAKRAYKFEQIMFEQRIQIKELQKKIEELEEYKYMYEELIK